MSAQRKHAADHIHGWGADLDHANRPAVPMERTPPRLHRRALGHSLRSRRSTVEILHSTERPGHHAGVRHRAAALRACPA